MSRDNTSARTLPPGAGGAAVLVAAWAGLAACDPVVRHPVAALACFAIAFGAYAFAVRHLLADERDGRPWRMGMMLAVAFACRLLAFSDTPSDDVHRYLWEARVLAAGHDPYRLPPDAPQLAHLAAIAPEHALVNHADWPAIYPPFMQWWQRAVVGLGAGTWGLKLSFVLAEALLCAALWALLVHRGLPPARLLIYAWNPLAVHATASQGHHDVVAAALLMSALLLWVRRSHASAAAAFACSVLAKGFALAALPAFIASRATRRTLAAHGAGGILRVAVAPLLVVTTLTLPFVLPVDPSGGDVGLLHALGRFGAEMHTNDSVHALAGFLMPARASRIAMLAIWALVALAVLRRGDDDPIHASAVLLGTLLLVLPTVHPWYLVILLPFLCFFPWWGWIALSGTVALTWLPQLEIQRTGQWVEWPLIKALEYAPLFAWLGLLAWRRWHGSPPAAPVPGPSTSPDSGHEPAS